MISRRNFMAAASAAAVSACVRPTDPAVVSRADSAPTAFPPLPAHYGAVTDEPYPVPAVPEGVVPPHLWRQEVANPSPTMRPERSWSIRMRHSCIWWARTGRPCAMAWAWALRALPGLAMR